MWRGCASIVGFALAWYALAAAASIIFATRDARLAGALGVTSAEGLAAEAQAILARPATPRSLRRSELLAREALSKQPVNVTAWRDLGLIAAAGNNAPRAEHFFEYAEHLSRRDLPTQLWLIEDCVRRGDISGALQHYDRALRTSPRTSQLLIPVLVEAAQKPPITRRLGDLLAARPPWWPAFFGQFVAAVRSPVSLASLAARLRLNPANAGEHDLLKGTIVRLDQLGAYREAYALYRVATPGAPEQPAPIRNGNFEAADALPPFDWSLADGVGLAATREPRPSGKNIALHLVADGSRSGEVARQTLLLPAGSYKLSVVAGDVSAASKVNPTLQLQCSSPLDGPAQALLELRFPDAPSAGTRFQRTFKVPTNCRSQLLVISVEATSLDDSAEPTDPPWIDDLTIERAGT